MSIGALGGVTSAPGNACTHHEWQGSLSALESTLPCFCFSSANCKSRSKSLLVESDHRTHRWIILHLCVYTCSKSCQGQHHSCYIKAAAARESYCWRHRTLSARYVIAWAATCITPMPRAQRGPKVALRTGVTSEAVWIQYVNANARTSPLLVSSLSSAASPSLLYISFSSNTCSSECLYRSSSSRASLPLSLPT